MLVGPSLERECLRVVLKTSIVVRGIGSRVAWARAGGTGSGGPRSLFLTTRADAAPEDADLCPPCLWRPLVSDEGDERAELSCRLEEGEDLEVADLEPSWWQCEDDEEEEDPEDDEGGFEHEDDEEDLEYDDDEEGLEYDDEEEEVLEYEDEEEGLEYDDDEEGPEYVDDEEGLEYDDEEEGPEYEDDEDPLPPWKPGGWVHESTSVTCSSFSIFSSFPLAGGSGDVKSMTSCCDVLGRGGGRSSSDKLTTFMAARTLDPHAGSSGQWCLSAMAQVQPAIEEVRLQPLRAPAQNLPLRRGSLDPSEASLRLAPCLSS